MHFQGDSGKFLSTCIVYPLFCLEMPRAHKLFPYLEIHTWYSECLSYTINH